MNFYIAYLRALFSKPQDAIVAMYWWCTGRKTRARNCLRLVARQSPFAYQMWIETTERAGDAADADAAMARWQHRPRISVILHRSTLAADADIARLVASLQAQTYPFWELILVSGREEAPMAGLDPGRLVAIAQVTDSAATALTLATAQAGGAYILPLSTGTVLPARALFRYVEALQAAPDASILYGDHDQIDEHGQRSAPWFKPRWNAEMFLAQDYMSSACLIATDAARRGLPIAPEFADAAGYALILAVTAASDARIVHVPYVLAHTSAAPEPTNRAARLAVVTARLAPRGALARSGPFGTLAIAWPLPAELPLVSIIVPTRDYPRLLRACITSVLTATAYQPYEVVIVDNGSVELETRLLLESLRQDPRVRVVVYDRPYNYSAINNFAAGHARGQYLCLLNNDTEVLGGEWLTELMRQAVRPEVGAAGAKLLYGDGTIQHAGVVVGLGDAAGHAHRFQPGDAPGYFARAHVAHYVSAVTAACLVVARAKFEAVGGLDEVGLQIAFNDVDFCLKLERAGWHNVYVPQAELVHHESKSRGKDSAPAQVKRYRRERALLQTRWGTLAYSDPLHHPHLDGTSEIYALRSPASPV